MGRALMLVLLLLIAGPVSAKEAAPAADDPRLEEHVTAIAAQLRCLVCQNQTIAESDADLAKDFRNQIRDKLREGRSERDIIDYMIARYGDFVLWRPPFKSKTMLLWVGPILLVLGGLLMLFRVIVRERKAGEIELSEADHARAALLLGSSPERGQ